MGLRKGIPEASAAFLKELGCTDGTLRNNRRVMGNLQAVCEAEGVKYVHLVKPELIDSYRHHRAISNSTWSKELEILRHFFRFCEDREWARFNPAKRVRTPKIKQTAKVPYTAEEFQRILEACDRFGRGAYERQRARAMILLMRFCGLSVVDVATLRHSEVRGAVLDRARHKTGETVRLPLPNLLQDTLCSLPVPRGTIGEPQFLFWSGNGTIRAAQRDVTRTLSTVFKLSGVPGAHAHRFRHTLATQMLEGGLSFEDVSSVLGSSPQIIRKHYAQWSVKRQERIENLLQTVHNGTILEQTQNGDCKFNQQNSLNGGRHGIRTHDPHVANVVLSQLS